MGLIYLYIYTSVGDVSARELPTPSACRFVEFTE
jgi:hypothetical protein